MSKFVRILPVAFLLAGLAFSALVGASQPAEETQDITAGLADEAMTTALETPEPIKNLENQGLEVVRSFPVGQSLMGWVVTFDGKDLIVYTTVDGEYLINGIVMDAQGVDLTEEHQRSWLPRPEWHDLETAYYLTEPSLKSSSDGQLETSTYLYVFFDPNCPFSQLAWLALQPYREAGAEIRWIPVAYLKPDSRNRAAALLDAEQPDELLALNMENFGQPNEALDVAIESRHREQLQANMDLMQGMGINGTPGWVWATDEEEVESLSGMPRLPRLAEITGLPRQEHPETELMRYR